MLTQIQRCKKCQGNHPTIMHADKMKYPRKEEFNRLEFKKNEPNTNSLASRCATLRVKILTPIVPAKLKVAGSDTEIVVKLLCSR